jgi:lipopolysaccharide/colanic/teichoic acid biosynthesis glycosyltransferase
MYRSDDELLVTGEVRPPYGEFGRSEQSRTGQANRRFTAVSKRAVDICFAIAVFIAGWWLFVAVGLAVLCTQGGPLLYRHKRIGRNGKEFDCLKFRSMVSDSAQVLEKHLRENPAAMEEWARDFKLTHDPRITGFGRFLRKSSLDELPQFWNVLIGEMSVVGPRPVVKAELDKYYGLSATAEYTSVRPGLTGPWQVSGRHTHTYEQRVALDVEYVRNLSLARDCRIVARTIKVVLTGDGAK